MYTLLTGATGLLGRFLLRDMLVAGMPVCVIVRPTRRDSPADRIETILHYWEATLARSLPRPIILSGHLLDPHLGLSDEDRQWVRENCSRVVHAAASLKFQADDHGEPQRTNIDGTKNLYAFCQRHGLDELHYVSSAYVAGLRAERVCETDLNIAESWRNNPYLGSKSVAEDFLRSTSTLRSLTIYRPSTIVGDSETGYTSTWHGFYTPLRFGQVVAPKLSIERLDQLNFLDLLNLTGDERKNLIPVDWVSAAMVEIIRTPSLHGKSYHLTHTQPVETRVMQDVFLELLAPLLGRDYRQESASWSEARESFQEQMRIYEAYWRTDPTFDRTNVDRAVSHLPCPRMDRARVHLLAKFAMDKNFGWPNEQAIPSDSQLEMNVRQLSQQEPLVPGWRDGSLCLAAQVTGHGGGDWHFHLEQDRLRSGGRGISPAAQVTFYANRQTWQQIGAQALTAEAALAQGRVIALGRDLPIDRLAALVGALAAMFSSTVGPSSIAERRPRPAVQHAN